MTTSNKHVLITGGAGLIGRILVDRLQAHYALTSFDLQAAPDMPSLVGNLTDFPAVLHACQGQEMVIHLAADPRVDSPWASNLSTNIQGTYHVFEAARQAGVPRLVVASSQHATGGFYLEEPYKAITEGRYQEVPPSYPLLDETCPIRPDGYYGTAKACGEALGSYYWDYHHLSSLHLRIGWVLATDDPMFSALAQTFWLSHRDVAQIVRRCLEAPATLGYDVFYATSDNRWKIWSILRAQQRLGYQPEDGVGEAADAWPKRRTAWMRTVRRESRRRGGTPPQSAPPAGMESLRVAWSTVPHSAVPARLRRGPQQDRRRTHPTLDPRRRSESPSRDLAGLYASSARAGSWASDCRCAASRRLTVAGWIRNNRAASA